MEPPARPSPQFEIVARGGGGRFPAWGLALAFAHPWIALAIVIAISVALAMAVWMLWRTVRRALFPSRAAPVQSDVPH